MARIEFLSHADMSKQNNDTNYRCDFANKQRNDTNYRFALSNHLGRISAKLHQKAY